MRIVERAVQGTDTSDEVNARVERDGGHVVVQWLCAEERCFDPERLAELIALVDMMSEHPDVWLAATDPFTEFLVRVVDGELYATVNVGGHNGHVSWAACKEMLEASLSA